MFSDLSAISLHDLLEIIVSIITIVASLYVLVKWIITPLHNRFLRPILTWARDFYDRANTVPEKLDNALKILNETVLPVINSLQYQFSTNSGKSIKDQITRIEDNVKLQDIKGKLMSDMLVEIGEYQCDSHGNTVWVNSALCKLFGLEYSEMLNNGWLSGVDDKERLHVWDQWKESVDKNIPLNMEYTIHNELTGETFRARTSAKCHRNNDGRILGFYGTVTKV